MQTPSLVREHRALEKLAGHFSGPERMHSSYWNDEPKRGEAVTDARVALDGFAVVQDYEQRLEDGSRFAGHGVFRYDMPSETYELHWFDSTGGPQRIFRGGFAGRKLVLTARAGDGWQRLTYDFNLRKGYRLKLETSEDGQLWNVALEGDNLADGNRRVAGMRANRTGAKKAAATRKAAPRKATAKKAVARKATAKKTTAKKATAKKASGKKASGKKATAKKAAGKKSAAKKPAAGKATARKATSKKTTAKKATAKKASARTATSRKAPGKKAPGKKATAKAQASTVEKRRRQGKASKKVGAARRANGNGSAAGEPVSQQRRKGAAHKAPRMPGLKNTSTRTGWHKTAAKGLRGS